MKPNAKRGTDPSWIDFNSAVAMQVGYKYKGDIKVNFNVPFMTNPFGGKRMYRKREIILRNPVFRPFRNDGETEYGIHNISDDTFCSVLPYLRLLESQLLNNPKFKKVKIIKKQRHEIMIEKATEKAALNNPIFNLFK